MKLVTQTQAFMIVNDYQHLKNTYLTTQVPLNNTIIDEVIGVEIELGWQVQLIGNYQDQEYIMDFFKHIQEFGIEFDFEKYGLTAQHDN